MKIYFVVDAYVGPSGGTERQLYWLIEALASQGHELKMFAFRRSRYTENPGVFPCAIEHLEIGSIASTRAMHTMWKFRKRIRAERPDVVHVLFNDAAVLVPAFCKTAGTKIFTSRRDMGFWYTPAYLRALGFANRWVDAIICNSVAVAEEVVRREGIRREKVKVIHNACQVLPDAVPAAVPVPGTTHREADTSQGWRPRICMVANIRRIKRMEDLLRAAAIVRDSVPEAEFRIVGEPLEAAYFDELQQLVGTLKLESAVRFLPKTDRPLEVMRQSHIGVLTSSSEGLSNTIMEYMACGLAVVCSEVGGNPELVRHGQEGFLYPAGSVSELADYIVALCQQPQRVADMGAQGRSRCEDFSLEKMVGLTLEAYRRPDATAAW